MRGGCADPVPAPRPPQNKPPPPHRPRHSTPKPDAHSTNLSCHRSAPTAGDFQIPIGRPNGASTLPHRGFLLGTLSNAGPAAARSVALVAGVRNPSPKATFPRRGLVLRYAPPG